MNFPNPFDRVHLPGLLAALTTIAAAIASPAVLDVLPAKWSAVILVLSSITQAFTKPLPKSPPSP